MATTNLDAVDLANAEVGGIINEDVMQQLFQIDPVEQPLIERIESSGAENQYREFVERNLRARNVDNALVDGQDVVVGTGDPGNRLGTYHQIMGDSVGVSERAQNVDPIARADELLFQVTQIQKEIRRDEEAIFLYPQAAQPGDGDEGNAASTGPGKLPGAPTWLVTHRNYETNAGSPPEYSGTGITGYPNVAPVPGTKRGLTDTMVKDMLEDIYTAGGNPTVALSHPKIIRQYSNYHFTSSARIATLTSDKKQSEGDNGMGLTAYGSVNVLATDFGLTIELVPDRQYELYDSDDGGAASADAGDLLLLDLDYWERSVLQGYETKPLAKTGLSDKRMVTCDVSLMCLQEKASGAVCDIDPTVAVTA